MGLYNIKTTPTADGVMLMEGSFGEPASNDVITREVAATLKELALSGGTLLKFSGPASLPVSMAVCHAVAHLFGAVACFDPKLQGFVVAISHDAAYGVGDILK